MSAALETLHPIASELNRKLEAAAPEIFAMLSALGRRLYFPKGILSQGAEAKARAKRINATIGIATEQRAPMRLPSLRAPPRRSRHRRRRTITRRRPGARPARALAREAARRESRRCAASRSVCRSSRSAITHGLALAGELFVDPGDTLLLPDKLWENYRLTYEVRLGARARDLPVLRRRAASTRAASRRRLASARSREAVVLLNFPNNPTGYMPTPAEGEAIVAALLRQAEAGTKLVVLVDDAYFGLFYHLGGALDDRVAVRDAGEPATRICSR